MQAAAFQLHYVNGRVSGATKSTMACAALALTLKKQKENQQRI
jgi:hypothetical protein